MDIDDGAIVIVIVAGVVEIVGAAAGLRGKRIIEKAAAGVAGVITATVASTTAIATAAMFATTATATAATTVTGRGRGRSGGAVFLLAAEWTSLDSSTWVFLLDTAVTVAAVAMPVRRCRLLSRWSLRSSLGSFAVFVSSISVVAAVPIRVGLISAATIVIATLVFARGKAARHARGQQRRC